jgi:ABC-type Na+ efflux pump permease subunit
VRLNPRKILRVARWEVSHTAGTLDRRTIAVGIAALLLAGGVAGAAATGHATAPNEDIYAVGIPEESPFYGPVENATALKPVSLDSQRAVVYVQDPVLEDREATVSIDRSAMGQAALSTFRDAVERHNDLLMRYQENQTAAFPVSVRLTYVTRERATTLPGASGATGGDGSGGSDGTDGTDGSDAGDDTGTGADSGDGTGAAGEPGADGDSGDDGPLSVPEIGGGGGGLFGGQSNGSPADIAPPFPFGSLLLAFIFLVPMNFVIQAYGSSILDERVNRRGELLLVAPLTRHDIVAGKTLPYVLAALAATVGIAWLVGGGIMSVASVFPVALVFLGATFLGAMFARSFKELTFVTVTVSVFLTTYVFVPAIFTTITPVALISPLTLVVRDLTAGGAETTPLQYLFSTGPFYIAAAVLFLLGIGVYREEDMFTQRSVPLKFLDALDARLSGPLSVGLLTMLFLPFVFVAELLGVAVLIAVPKSAAIPALLVVVAVVEEIAKSVHVYAGFAKSRFERTLPTALKLGVISGTGFFIAEKGMAIVQIVGLDRLPLGEAAFAPSGIGIAGAIGLLFAPLVLHVVTACVAVLGATRDRASYAATLLAAMVLHFAYDYFVVVIFLG